MSLRRFLADAEDECDRVVQAEQRVAWDMFCAVREAALKQDKDCWFSMSFRTKEAARHVASGLMVDVGCIDVQVHTTALHVNEVVYTVEARIPAACARSML